MTKVPQKRELNKEKTPEICIVLLDNQCMYVKNLLKAEKIILSKNE